MGDLEERVLRLETTVKLMQTQLEAINKNIFGGPRDINVQQSFRIVAAENLPDYPNEPSPPDDVYEGGQGCHESIEEILGDIGEPLGHLRVEIPEQIDLKPPQIVNHFKLKACQVVLTRIPPDQLIKYEPIPSQSNLEPPPDPMPRSSKRRLVISKETYSNAKRYSPRGRDPLLCGHCPQSIKYTSNSQLLAHLSSEHPISGRIFTQIRKCRYCQRCFKSDAELKSHIDSDEVKGLYTCTDCPRQSGRKPDIIIHWSRAHDKSTEFICEYCSRVFYNPRDLATHFREKHPDGIDDFQCPDPSCRETLTGKSSLNRHIRRRHPGQLPLRLPTNLSKKQTQIKPDLDHESSSKSKPPSPTPEPAESPQNNCLKCPISSCKMTYKTNVNFNRHITIKHPSHLHLRLPTPKMVKKRGIKGSFIFFMCHICSKVFSYRHYFKLHLQIHSEDRPRFICEKCGASYYEKTNLRIHMREKHEGIQVRQDKLCPICGVTCHWNSLAGHMRKHNERVHKCSFCPAKFKNATNLKGHRSSHTGELAVDCPTCGKTYSNPANLREHMFLHKEAKDIPCKDKDCGRKFKNLGQRNEHWRLRHKNQPRKVEQVDSNDN